jgi:endonuclease/exonuclease/phosphatase family metal-dependent hydrolase
MKKLYSLLLLILLVGVVTSGAQVNLQVINSPYSQNFDSLASAGTTNDVSTLPLGWTFLETGTNANTTYAAGTGSGNAGNTYSYGLDSERALGGLLSGSLTPTIGAFFTNNTGSTITSVSIVYRGEQWRLGATGRTDRLDFQFSTDAASLSSGTWSDVNELDFLAPVSAGTAGALIGNDTVNNNTVSFTISGLNLEPGSSFALRWQDFNASGADDGLAIDNFSLTPNGLPSDQPSIVITPVALNFGDINVNETDTLTLSVEGSNLSDPIVLVTNGPYELSIDGISFDTATSLPDSGGIVYVKFAPTSAGLFPDSVFFQSGSTFARIFVNGKGFDQVASIISIAEARTKPAGEKVTVAGRITVADEHGSPSFIQDATGGIPVFDFNLSQSVSIGDSIIVTGPISLFNEQKQISGAGIFFTKPDSSTRIISPKVIAINELAANEGLLVTVMNVELVNKSFVFYPQSTERITSGGTQADLRIDGDTDIPGLTKPQGTFDVTGVVGRFRANAQLLPRFRSDIPGADEPSTPADSIPRSATFDVVNWNLEFFGATREDYPEEYGPADEPLQLENVKTVLLSLDADIIAVQEVSSDSLFAELVRQLPHHAFTCSNRYSYSFQGPDDEFPPQKLCFIYDTTTVDLVNARVVFENLYDSARTVDPTLLPGYPSGDPSSFYSSGRLPYLATFDATINGVTERISLIDIHAKSGSSAADRNRRLYDATVLKDSLDANFPSEKFIILGDLNDDLDQSITTGQPTPYAAFVNDTARYNPITKALSEAGARSTVSFNDVIDHQILSDELSPDYIASSVQINTPFGLITNYAGTTSDHLPVISRFVFEAPEVNFVTQSQVTQESTTTIPVVLSVSEISDEPRTVKIRLSGNGSYGSDFTTSPPASGDTLSVTVPAYADSVSFAVDLLEDIIDEVQESVVFTIEPSVGLVPGDNNTISITIDDNDIPVIQFSQLLYAEREGSGDHQIKFNLSTPPATDQQVTLVVINGPGVSYESDYSTTPGPTQNRIVVTLPAGTAQPSIVLNPKSDTRRELPELVSFYIESASTGLVLGNLRLTIFTILDGTRRQLQFIASPNPTFGQLRITSRDIADNEILHAEMRNPDGTIVFSGQGTLKQLGEQTTARLEHGKRGFYTLKLMIDEEVFLLRVLKN